MEASHSSDEPTSSSRKFDRSGLSQHDVMVQLRELRLADAEWNDPKNLKAAYFAGEDVLKVSWDAYETYKSDNLLYGKLLYPSLSKMADDVVDMTLDMLNAGKFGYGTFTSGGTESIILAVRTAREWARENKDCSSVPEIVVPHTCHAAFTKAADLLGMRIKRVPVDSDFRADPQLIKDAISPNTVMIVGSAPAYPIGSVDPIESLAEIAHEKDLWLHVDACVGGFFLPFAVDLGDKIPPFDFSIAGVKSMSVDLHKYGYSSRGASLLLLHHESCEKYQRFEFKEWPTGQFNTTTLAGSRPGGAVASAWAVMKYLGFDGYRNRVEKIIAARNALVDQLNNIEEVRVLGRPGAGIVGFSSNGAADMAAVREGMIQKGWKFAPLVDPSGLNVLLNYTHGSVIDSFTNDLRFTIKEALAGRLTASGGADSYGG